MMGSVSRSTLLEQLVPSSRQRAVRWTLVVTNSVGLMVLFILAGGGL